MKKSLFVVTFIAIAISAGLFINKQDKTETTKTEAVETEFTFNKISKAARIEEAMKWRMKLLADPVTGEFDVNNYFTAVEKANTLKADAANKKKGVLNLDWELLGPDNQGGRTRALIFDAVVPNKLWAGGVGGGLFQSLDGGNNWSRVLTYDGFFPIASITQDVNGVLYVGTGEGLGNPLSFSGSSGFDSQSPGNGVYKSTDDGATWVHLESTIDVNDNQVTSGSCDWCGVNALAVSPINPNLVFAGTEGGLKISTNGGVGPGSFVDVTGAPASTQIQAITVTADGQTAFVVVNGKLFRSVDVNNNFLSGWVAMDPTGGRRADVAIAPTNPNYVYVSVSATNNCMTGIWRSIDGGDTWTEIVEGGAPYAKDPFNQPTSELGACAGQGWYDHTLAVNPADENKIYVGGITLYTWGDGFGFKKANRIGTEGAGNFDSDYIHADVHEIIFDPQDPTGNKMLVGSDGGVTLCNNANSGFPDNLTYIQKNKGYVTLQVYGSGSGAAGEVIGGTQDNGTQYIDGLGSSPQAAKSTSGGDGVYAEISNLVPDVLFGGVYYGAINRSVNRGLSTGAFLDVNIDPRGCGQISCSATSTTPCASLQDAGFIYPFYLMETSSVTDQDTVAFLIARDETLLLASGATQLIMDTLFPSYSVTTITTISENDTIIERTVNNSPNYQATSMVANSVKFDVTLDQVILPGDTQRFADPYDAKYFVTSVCGLWMCTNPLQKNEEPVFYKISNSSSNISGFDASSDGNHLYYVVGNRLTVVSGLNSVNSTLDPDGCANASCTSAGLTITQIVIPGASGLEGVGVDKNDKDVVLVTASGFNATGKVFRVEGATTGAATVTPLHTTDATLPFMPIYDCVIDYENSDRYIVGSELGIWSSDDAGQTWSEENDGMFGRMPIYRLRQEWMYEETCMVTYAGTHGGGIFRTTTLMNSSCDPVPYQWQKVDPAVTTIREVAATNITNIKLYPNPVTTSANIEFDLNNSTSIGVKVYDITGKLVISKSFGKLYTGNQTVKFNTSDIVSGNYIAVLTANGKPIGNVNIIKK